MLNSTNRISNCLIYMQIVAEIDVLTYEKYTYIHTHHTAISRNKCIIPHCPITSLFPPRHVLTHTDFVPQSNGGIISVDFLVHWPPEANS